MKPAKTDKTEVKAAARVSRSKSMGKNIVASKSKSPVKVVNSKAKA